MARTKSTPKRSLGGSAVRVRLRPPSPLPSRSNTPPNHTSFGSLPSRSSRHSTPVSLSSSHEDLIKELEDAQAHGHELETELQNLRDLSEATQIHCYFANKMLKYTQRKLYRLTPECKCAKHLNTMSHMLAYEEGQAEDEEWQKRLEVMQKKANEDLERRRKPEQQDDSAVFSGALHKKKKGELSDIVASLHLDERGTVAALVERIRTFLQTNGAIRYSERYAGLQLDHPRLRGTKRATPGHSDDNANQPSGSSQHKRARTSTSSTSNFPTAPAMSTFAVGPV